MFEEPRGGLCGLTGPVIRNCQSNGQGFGFYFKSIGAPLKGFLYNKIVSPDL